MNAIKSLLTLLLVYDGIGFALAGMWFIAPVLAIGLTVAIWRWA